VSERGRGDQAVLDRHRTTARAKRRLRSATAHKGRHRYVERRQPWQPGLRPMQVVLIEVTSAPSMGLATRASLERRSYHRKNTNRGACLAPRFRVAGAGFASISTRFYTVLVHGVAT
jgi:hypothetical protein